MVLCMMPVGHAHAADHVTYQVADTAATDLGLTNVGDSAMFVIVSAVTSGKEMVANVGTSSAGYTGFELASRSDANDVADNAVWTITKVENGYTVSNGGLNVAVKANHQVGLEAGAVVQIKKGNNNTDDWVIHNGSGWCLNDHDNFGGTFANSSGSSNALSTYTNLVGGRSMLKLYKVTSITSKHEYDNACDATCNICNAEREVGEHDYVGEYTKPTRTEQGYTTYTCANCGDSYIADYVDAKGHSFGEWIETTAPGCETEGVETRSCHCGETETQSVAATGHDYEAVVTAPTFEADGYTTYTCTECGATPTR